jgi:hypothetical protein
LATAHGDIAENAKNKGFNPPLPAEERGKAIEHAD